MLFKNIEEFEDLTKIDNCELENLIWKANTSIPEYQKIKLSELEYDTTLSEMIFFLIKTSQDRKQEDLDRCFKLS